MRNGLRWNKGGEEKEEKRVIPEDSAASGLLQHLLLCHHHQHMFTLEFLHSRAGPCSRSRSCAMLAASTNSQTFRQEFLQNQPSRIQFLILSHAAAAAHLQGSTFISQLCSTLVCVCDFGTKSEKLRYIKVLFFSCEGPICKAL